MAACAIDPAMPAHIGRLSRRGLCRQPDETRMSAPSPGRQEDHGPFAGLRQPRA